MPKLMLRIPPAARIRSVGGPNFHTPERERLRQLGEELRQLFLQNKRDVLNSLGLEAEDLVKGQELFDTRIHEMDTTYLGIIDLMANSEGNQKRVIAKLEESFAKLDRALDEIAGPATERITQRLEETVTLGYDDLDKGASERYSRIIETLRAIDGLEGTSCNLGVAISPSLRDDIRAILDPGNMEHMLNVGKCALREYMSGIRCYMDEEVRTHIRTFIDRFLGIAKEFISEKEWTKTACFKAICYTHAKKSANVHAMYEQRMDTVLGKSMLASEAGLCPYLLFFDTQVLDEAAEIVRGIKTDRTARAVMENQRWITPRRFEELKELTGLLDVFAVKKESCAFELVGGLTVQTAIKILKKIETTPEYLELYKRLTEPKRMVSRSDFLAYILEIAEETVNNSGNATFHSLLKQIEPSVHITELAQIIRAASIIFISERWKDLALFLTGNAEDREIAKATLQAMEYGELENAIEIIDRRKEGKKREEELGIEALVKRAFPDIEDDQVRLFRGVYVRLERNGVRPTRFSSLREHGVDALARIAGITAGLSDFSLKTIFASDNARRTFAELVRLIAADEKEILDWINAVAGSREHNAETRERTIIEIMQNYIDEKGVAVQTSVGRIIVICGGNIMTNIQDTLAERTGKEVRVIDGSYVKPSAIAAAIGENDTVVIVVTHIGHNASGSATSICRSRGIPFVICRNTNAERIADRITALAA